MCMTTPTTRARMLRHLLEAHAAQGAREITLTVHTDDFSRDVALALEMQSARPIPKVFAVPVSAPEAAPESRRAAHG